MGQKRNRSANFTAEEKATLTVLVEKYKYILDNKKTDTFTNEKKEQAWGKILAEYNASCVIQRSTRQLKQAYENYKKRRKAAALEQGEGGSATPQQVDSTTEKLLSMLGNGTVPLSNMSDLDTGYSEMVASVKIEEPEQMADETGSLCLEVENHMASSSADEPEPEPDDPKTKSNVPSSSTDCPEPESDVPKTRKSNSLSHKEYREQRNSRKRKRNPEAIIATERCADVMNRICEMAMEKALYYKGRLDLERSESAKRMLMAEEEHKMKVKLLQMEAELMRKKIDET